MGTLKRLLNKVIDKSEESEKEIVAVETEKKHPVLKITRSFMPQFMPSVIYNTTPGFYPKRTKLKGWQKENKRFKSLK